MTNSITALENELSTRDKVFIAEKLMLEMPQRDLKFDNFFSLGVYARQLYIPKNTTLVGKIHKYQNLNILAQGEMSVLMDDGIVRVKAPFTVVSPAGTKRIAYTHSDCVWITIHGTHETDLDKIEQEFIAQDEDEYLKFCKQDQLLLDI